MLEDGYIFPGATVVEWEPVKKKLTGKVADAVDYVTDWFRDADGDELSLVAVRDGIGMKDKDNFNRLVAKHPSFEAALANQGISIERRMGRSGSRLVRTVDYVDDQDSQDLPEAVLAHTSAAADLGLPFSPFD
jgi:hypothetical protein